MSSKSINYLLISIFSVFIFIFGIMLINNMDSSYAYNIVSASYPNSDFTTNYRNSKINYISEALVRNSNSSTFVNSLEVADNLGTSSGNIIYLLQRNLEIPASTEKFEISSENPTSINDTGIMYIINHGYNNFNKLNHIFSSSSEYGTANVNQKYYVTQIALWLYLAEKESSFTDICHNNACKFVDTSGNSVSANNVRTLINTCSEYDGYKFLKYIIKLVDDAKSYNGNSSTPAIAANSSNRATYTLDDSKNFITTDLETLEITSNGDNFLYYTFEIDDPDNLGIYLTDNNGNRLNEASIYHRSFGFKINIPLKDDIESIDLTSTIIHIYGHFVLDVPIRNYRVTDSSNGLLLPAPLKSQKYSNVLLGTAQEYATELKYNLMNFVTVSKVDITNNKELPGAKLKVTRKSDSAIYEWTSTSKAHYFALEVGEYTLCETAAPDGYKLKEECIDFTFDGTHIVSLKMENEPIVEVGTPNTALFKGLSKYIFGIVLIIAGIGIFIVSYKKTNN